MESTPESVMTDHLRLVLMKYEPFIGHSIRFGEVTPFKDVSGEKPYSFRTNVPVKLISRCVDRDLGHIYPGYIGIMHIIGFRYGDGTGAESETKFGRLGFGDLNVPEQYRFERNPEKVIPREKAANGVAAELFFPLFSFDEQKAVFSDYAVRLEELTIDDHKVVLGGNRIISPGIEHECYLGAIKSAEPKLYFTTGNLPTGRRFGDPHAIICSDVGIGKDIIQVAGFLPISGYNVSLANLANELFFKGKAVIPARD